MAGVEVVGLNQLVRTLNQAKLEIENLKDANARAGETVRQWAAVTAPRRTGALGGSVRAGRRARGATISSRLVYASVIHWGWPGHHIAAQPFISDAATATESAWVADYERDIQQILDKVKGA